jgi:DNA polymerase III subunit epsilon
VIVQDSPAAALPVFVAFDVETTGLIAGVDRVVELAAVAFQGEQVVEAFSALVNPGVPVPAVVTRVTGITDETLIGAPPPAGPLADFLRTLSRGTPVAHNAVFDVGFVLTEAQEAGLALPQGPVLDTRGLARRAFPGRFSYGLGNLVKDLQIQTLGVHRALADAHACRTLFLECVRRLGKDGEPALEELARLSGAPLDFHGHAPRQPGIARMLQKAVLAGSGVQITYRSSDGEITERMIMPLSISCVGGDPAVRAFCTLRGDNRTFFLGSIVEAHQP